MAMVYEADTLRDILFNNWALTGNLSKEGTAQIMRPVHFFAYEQIPSKRQNKSVEVIKMTSSDSERSTEFFTREESTYRIVITRIINESNRAGRDASESDIEDMEEEVERIIKANFANPQTGTNVWFTADFIWRNEDEIAVGQKAKPLMKRILMLTFTRIISRSTNVFDSFQRGIIYDALNSANEDNGPVSDYNYTEVSNVQEREGHRVKDIQVTSHPDGLGFPIMYAGGFGGLLTMFSYVKSDDIGSTDDKINNIFLRQVNGELVEVVLKRTYTNRNSQTLTITTHLHLQEKMLLEGPHDLLQYQLLAKIIKPSTMVVS